MKKLEWKKAFSAAKMEYIKWIGDSRMVLLSIYLIFIYQFVISPLMINAQMMNDKIHFLEPFIAVTNSQMIILIVPLMFLALIADFPRVDTNTVFVISRMGRMNWMLAQYLKLVMMAGSFLGFTFVGCILLCATKVHYTLGWSDVVTGFEQRFPQYASNAGAMLLPKNIYYQLKDYVTVLHSIVLIFLYLMLIGTILLLFTVMQKKLLGFVLSGCMIALGAAFFAVKTSLMWAFPMANSIVWLHYTKFLRKPLMPIWCSYLYFIIILTGLTIVGFGKAKKINYDNVLETVY